MNTQQRRRRQQQQQRWHWRKSGNVEITDSVDKKCRQLHAMTLVSFNNLFFWKFNAVHFLCSLVCFVIDFFGASFIHTHTRTIIAIQATSYLFENLRVELTRNTCRPERAKGLNTKHYQRIVVQNSRDYFYYNFIPFLFTKYKFIHQKWVIIQLMILPQFSIYEWKKRI